MRADMESAPTIELLRLDWVDGNIRTSKGRPYVNNKKGSPQGRGLIRLLFQIVLAKSNSAQLHVLDVLLQDGLVTL